MGLRIVEHLTEQQAELTYLVLDDANKGGFNEAIASIYKRFLTDNEGQLAGSHQLHDEGFIDELERARISLGISAWWGGILRGRILDIPGRGWINCHPSYLPFNRGVHPNFWCLVDETSCGVSLHYIDEGIDTGAIIAREPLRVSWEDTGETIYHRSRELIVELFKRTYSETNGFREVRGIPQQEDGTTFHRKKDIEEASRIDLDKPETPRKIFNIVRAKMFPPHSPASFLDEGKKYLIEINIREADNDG